MDYTVNVEVPFIPTGFQSSNALAAPRKKGRIIITKASSTCRKKKVSQTLSRIFLVSDLEVGQSHFVALIR